MKRLWRWIRQLFWRQKWYEIDTRRAEVRAALRRAIEAEYAARELLSRG